MKIFLILLLFSINAWAESDTDRKSELMYEFMKNCKELGLNCQDNMLGNTHNYNTYITPQCNNKQKARIEYSDEGRIKSITCEDKL